MSLNAHTTLRWSGRKRKRRPLLALAWVAVGAFGLAFLWGITSWVADSVASWVGVRSDVFPDINESCADNGFGCNVTVEMLGTLAAIAVAYVYFTSWRIKRVIDPHLKDAATNPSALVPTASPMDEVVGRTGLCEILEKDLARVNSRPQVIVAGVGDGKTAVLVKLTQYLFEQGAVPVPVALRDAAKDLDFRTLAKNRFLDRVGSSLLSEDEGDKVWRELCNARLIVVLADGLEEALPNTDDHERAKRIQFAIDRANDVDLPLVIATRPHPALKDIDVAVLRLEPLSARSVVEYISRGEGATDDIKRIARTAEVMERPLYLRLARDLHRRQALGTIPIHDRVRTRLELLRSWRHLLIEQPVRGDVRMRKEDREQALETAEVMASVALATNSLEVDFEQLVRSTYVPFDEEKLRETEVFAGHAERLDLVESIPNGVRFRHSIVQAYLGAQRFSTLLADGEPPRYLEEALANPGRELMMALVMSCLLDGQSPQPEILRGQLSNRAEDFEDHTSFELLAAAYEIHALTDGTGADELGNATLRTWRRARSQPHDIELTEAKMRATLPIGEAAERGDSGACRALWQICQLEDAYVVRVEAAHALARAGFDALAVIHQEIETALEQVGTLLAYRDGHPPEPRWQDVRRFSILGWIMPLLAITGEDSMRTSIETWVALAKEGTPEHPGLHLGVEAALAQGFKWEANRMPRQGDEVGRAFLIAHALDLLEGPRWWQTEVNVLQALALWALDDKQPRQSDIRKRIASYQRRSRHPFVREVASRCTIALRRELTTGVPARDTGPSRYMWIDEVGVAAKIGPKRLPPDKVTRLWIPPATGLHALSPRTRQLLGDVLVFLNLVEGAAGSAGTDAERTAKVHEREARRLRVYKRGPALPRCLTRPASRRRLAVDRYSAAEDQESSCTEQHGCQFGLCPYPAREERPFRGELPETFCRAEQRHLRGPQAGVPPWTDGLFRHIVRRSRVNEIREFWERMEQRDQG